VVLRGEHDHGNVTRPAVHRAVLVAALLALAAPGLAAQPRSVSGNCTSSTTPHFPPHQLHPGKAPTARFLAIMGDKIGRSVGVRPAAAADLVVRQHRRLRTLYYLQTDAPLYYYSFTDAAIAMPTGP